MVYITLKGDDNFAEVKNNLTQMHGVPEQNDATHHKYVWGADQTVSISLEYKVQHKLASLIYLYKPISELEKRHYSNQ